MGFDLIEDADIGRIHEGAIEGYYQWAFAKKLFKEIELKSVKATVYFQLSNHDSDEGVLERVTFIGAKGKQIKTDSNYALSITEFVNGVNANDDLLFGRPKKPIAPDLLPDCNTIEELWNESYLKMIVRNTFSGDIIYVYGKDGKLTKDFQTGKIRCSYANINKTTGLFYPKEGFYNAFDGDKRIWKLVHAFKDPKHEQRMKDLENIAKLDTDGYQTIDEITQHNTSRSLIVDNLYTKKKYFLSFVNDFGRYTRFDIYEVDLESGTLSDTPLNGSLYLLYNQKIWKIVTG